AREADGDARGDAEIPEHERHCTGEVLAVAGLRARDEVDERRHAAGLDRLLVVPETARGTEPALELDDGLVRRARTARHAQCGVDERSVRPELLRTRLAEDLAALLGLARLAERDHPRARVDVEIRAKQAGIVGPHPAQLIRSRPRHGAP